MSQVDRTYGSTLSCPTVWNEKQHEVRKYTNAWAVTNMA